MRTHLTPRTVWLPVAAALLIAAGCGNDTDNGAHAGGGEGAAAAGDTAADSPYCEAAIDWAVHEMTPFDDANPEQFRAYWQRYAAFEDEALATAPATIKVDWERKIEVENATIDVVLEKYGYDIGVIMATASPEEQASLDAPPDVQAAQQRILTYESEVCGSQFPVAADVSYDGERPGPYCELVAAEDERAAEAMASGDPAAIEAYVTGAAEAGAAIVAAAPDAIKDDVEAVSDWTSNQQAEALAVHGWDMQALMRSGSAQDRYALNFADEDIREQYSRVVAYEEQVCGA